MKHFGLIIFLILFASLTSFAQSTNESFPTPINAAEISGTIAARDIGDSRLTRHFYTFFAENGDLNLNIETANFDGDVDLFEAGTLRPIAKITVAASGEAAKTSRIVYFRKREQIILRVEGRTLVDEAARYKINFSGSFAAAAGLPAPPEDLTPKVERQPSAEAVARVNSAGAIVEVLPTKKPAPKPVEESIETEEKPTPEPTTARKTTRTTRTRRTAPARRRTAAPPAQTENAPPSSEETAAATETKPVLAPRRTRPTRQPRTRQPAAKRTNETPPAPQPDPLANVRLTIQLKNGEQVERPMSEIFRVSVDKGQLTVITKSGKIERYNLLEVAKFSIEQ